MPSSLVIKNPNFDDLGYIIVIANLDEKHDRSAPSDYHWKILKCRMIIFSNSSVLACPDKNDLKRIHIIFNKVGDDYDKLNSLFLKFSLAQDGEICATTPEVYEMCIQYTIMAKIAPVWNTLGQEYLINNRDFLTTSGPQHGVQYTFTSNPSSSLTTGVVAVQVAHELHTSASTTIMNLKPVKINFMRTKEAYLPGEWIRVLPSLYKAVVEDFSENLPQTARFKCYKDLRRHWKNIHGYRLPEEECPYYLIRFWRGEPLTYPQYCLTRNFPIITPVPKHEQEATLLRLLSYLKNKSPQVLGIPLHITYQKMHEPQPTTPIDHVHGNLLDTTQAISLCTPTQVLKK